MRIGSQTPQRNAPFRSRNISCKQKQKGRKKKKNKKIKKKNKKKKKKIQKTPVHGVEGLEGETMELVDSQRTRLLVNDAKVDVVNPLVLLALVVDVALRRKNFALETLLKHSFHQDLHKRKKTKKKKMKDKIKSLFPNLDPVSLFRRRHGPNTLANKNQLGEEKKKKKKKKKKKNATFA
jgi:hypothetical protein